MNFPKFIIQGVRMRYEYNEKVKVEDITDLRAAVGWPRMEADYRNETISNYYHIACYKNNFLIGYGEIISNGVTDGYIQDVMVHPGYQGRGIGTEIINRCISFLKKNDIYMISVIYGEEKLKAFYEKFGFSTMLCGQMETRLPK